MRIPILAIVAKNKHFPRLRGPIPPSIIERIKAAQNTAQSFERSYVLMNIGREIATELTKTEHGVQMEAYHVTAPEPLERQAGLATQSTSPALGGK